MRWRIEGCVPAGRLALLAMVSFVGPERKPRVRLTSIPDDGVFVVRGDELDDTGGS